MASYRIGIDVGGTFTHAVALTCEGLELAAQAKVPTTHGAPGGVCEGVVQVLRAVLAAGPIQPEQVAFVAYSTTQVTNALLEGDVAPVGILALGAGLEGRRARRDTCLGDLELAPGRSLHTFHAFLNTDRFDEAAVRAALAALCSSGAQAIVAAEPFSVDDPRREQLVLAAARDLGLPATGTHEISGRYGLRVRTRTAVINASLLPRTIATAKMTERAAREAGLLAPLMVVRSDGGVMSVEEMRRRPLLTLLSGPAAGVAAALMYARVTDGVFLEVGGTSTDITAIQHGRAALRTAEVGGHRLFLRTLDVRTIGLAGGSLPRVRAGRLHDVGPRSAHLAGLTYACFADREQIGDQARAELLSPLPGDPADYLVIETLAGRMALTLTCAANAAGRLPAGDFACGDQLAALAAAGPLGRLLRCDAEAAAAEVLSAAADKAARTVAAVLEERGLPRETTELVAGGGAAAVLAPAVGERVGLPVRLAANAPLVSAIGTALALVRDIVERTVPEATERDLLEIRREAAEAAVRAGADPESVTVHVEYDPRRALLRAVATGHAELRTRDAAQPLASDEERREAAAKFLRVAPDQVALEADSGLLRAYAATRERKRLLGLLTDRRRTIAVVDQRGVVRLLLPEGRADACLACRLRETLAALLEGHTRYGDAGPELPRVFLGLRARIVDLSGVLGAAQMLALAGAEADGLPGDEPVLVAVAPPRP